MNVRGALTALSLIALVAAGCGPKTARPAEQVEARFGDQPYFTVSLLVLQADGAAAAKLKAFDEKPDAVRAKLIRGAGAVYALNNYHISRLSALARAGKGVELLVENETEVEACAQRLMTFQAPGERQVELSVQVMPGGCCGVSLYDTTGTIRDAAGERSATFTSDLPRSRRVLLELPPAQPRGPWTWFIIDAN